MTVGSGVDSPEVHDSSEWNRVFGDEDDEDSGAFSGPEGITQERGSLSDPTFHQMSVAELRALQKKEEDEEGEERAAEEKTDSGRWKDSGLFLTPSFQERAAEDAAEDEQERLAKLAGLGRDEAIGPEGVPKKIPPMPFTEPDFAVPARRIGGMVWFFLGILIGLTGYMLDAFYASTFVATPVAIVGLLLLTATRWSGYVALISAVVGGVGSCVLGAQLLLGDQMPMMLGGGLLSGPAIGLAFVGFGVVLILGNLLMLAGGPGIARNLVSGAVLVLGLLGLMLVVHLSDIRPVLTAPAGSFQPARHGSSAEGFTFSKPEGWATYSWSEVVDLSPLAAGLASPPEYHFVNRNQDIMVAFYVEETPRLTLAQLLGREEPTMLEQEISRGLPAVTAEAEQFQFRGHDFVENTYQGVLDSGERLAITVARAQLGPQRSFYVAATRDRDTRATHRDVENALNAFYAELRLVDPEG